MNVWRAAVWIALSGRLVHVYPQKHRWKRKKYERDRGQTFTCRCVKHTATHTQVRTHSCMTKRQIIKKCKQSLQGDNKTHISMKLFFSLSCLRLYYVPVKSHSHVEKVSSPNHTWASLTISKQLTSTYLVTDSNPS